MKGFQRILLTSDFSEHAALAAARAGLLAASGLKELLLLHVIPSSPLHELEHLLDESDSGTGLRARLQDSALNQLREQAARFAAVPGTKVECQVETGRPHTVIADVAASWADLIVMGAHGGNFVRDLFLGAMVEKVLRSSRQPLLVVKQPPEQPYRRVLVAIDFSPSSAAAAEAAQHVAPDAEICLCHVFEIPFEEKLRFTGVSDRQLTGYREESRYLAERNMASFLRARPELEKVALSKLEYGYAPAALLHIAGQLDSDLIVMGRHGQSELEHWLLGSVTEHVVRESRCDVLIVNH